MLPPVFEGSRRESVPGTGSGSSYLAGLRGAGSPACRNTGPLEAGPLAESEYDLLHHQPHPADAGSFILLPGFFHW
ncbi:MAG: hypothetical protein AVO35_08840 [Candidatus Aegiribacteria sp. MLS_C]|nr:MAG: hypothetical protein AVO35_08840 [Candidatus Aegiribacteria sp. MLS_C]